MNSLASSFRSLLVAIASTMLACDPAALAATDKPTVESLKAEYKIVLDIIDGNAPADLLIKNIKVVDVFTNGVYPGSLLIHGEKIIAVNPSEKISAKAVFDGRGMYAIPGLIDAHFHIESQMATPATMQSILAPHGTTAVYAETNDLVSAAQEDGVAAAKEVFKGYERFPYRLYAFAPGKKVDAGIAIKLLDWAPVIGMGELNHNLLLAGNEDEFLKLATTNSRNMLIDGHVQTNRSSDQLNLFPALGTSNNHNALTYADTVADLRIGLPTVVRDMLGCLERIIPGVVNNHLPTDNLLLGTDNIAVGTLVQSGHMDNIVQKVIGMGVNPIEAIKMASYNVARSFKMEDKLGSLTPGRFADIVLIPRMDEIKPAYVFKGGKLVAENGKLTSGSEIEVDYSGVIMSTKPGLGDLKREELELKPIEVSPDGARVKVFVWSQSFADGDGFAEQWLNAKDGKIIPEFNGQKLSRISVIERYAKHGKRNILNAYIVGYNIKSGAIGMNMAAPSQHIGVIGSSVDDLLFEAKELDKHTGAFMTTGSGEVKAVLDLPIYSMMTPLPASEIIKAQSQLAASGTSIGYDDGMPWFRKMSYLFFSLDRYGKIH
ncbi:adenine deaminase C-terminal domain-containing protein [Afipia sp. GAS231]|uniref:adenine deaminase C-terminal domain-containing protein n=1 Tax=Afipia sp. GAS231 TaxID=1882747 RepID=UPI00087B3EB3|nr:adenine deaminase C-terminal domain-containing protein [Afipia sp. GAS231]SDN38193.1 Adenine deaminase [Afipia sp. GAS231]